jgi:hypothetical protein
MNPEIDVDYCAVCNFHFVSSLAGDRRIHRARHRALLRVIEPQPNSALAKLHAVQGSFVPVSNQSPRWLRHRLYEIARTFKREMKFDFVQWGEDNDDGHGCIIADEAGRAIGGFVVRWRGDYYPPETPDWAKGWALTWVWIAPPYRRQGWLRRTWQTLTCCYSGIIPEPPFSPAAATFFATCDIPPELRKQRKRDDSNCAPTRA